MRNTILFIYLFSIATISCDRDKGSIHESGWHKSVENIIIAENEKNQFDGTIVIGSKDEIKFKYAIGTADRTWNIEISNNTRFDIASLNKSFQAALILKAVEENRLSLNDKLIDFFPNLQFDSTISIHHLLTHTSGLPDYDAVNEDFKADNFKAFKRLTFDNPDYASFISQLEPLSGSGEQFHYSNFGYHLLAIILEKVYQKPFPDLIKEKICKPYQLEHTFSETNNRNIHREIAEGYTYSEKDSSYLRNNFIDLTLGRRIFSTSVDLYKWSRLLMSGEFISKESYDLMTTNHLVDIEKDISYGYGFVVFDGGEYKMGNLGINKNYIIHGGATEGYKSILVNINDGELIIALLSNIGNRTNELKLTETIIKNVIE